jgi:hypothetical protein
VKPPIKTLFFQWVTGSSVLRWARRGHCHKTATARL